MLTENSEIHNLRQEIDDLNNRIRENINSLGAAVLENPSTAGDDPKLKKAVSEGKETEEAVKGYLAKIDDIEDIKERTKLLSSEIKDLTKEKAKCCDDMGAVYISIGRDAYEHFRETGQSTVSTDKYYKEIIREQEKLNELEEKMSSQELEPEKNIVSVILKKSKVTFTDSRIKNVKNLIDNLFKKAGADFSETDFFDELIKNDQISAIDKYKVLKNNILHLDESLEKIKEEKEAIANKSRTEYGIKGLTVALLEINKELKVLKEKYDDSLSEVGSLFLKGNEKGNSQTENLKEGILRLEEEEEAKQKLLDKLLAQEEIRTLSKKKDKLDQKISGIESSIEKEKRELKTLRTETKELEKLIETQNLIVEKNS